MLAGDTEKQSSMLIILSGAMDSTGSHVIEALPACAFKHICRRVPLFSVLSNKKSEFLIGTAGVGLLVALNDTYYF